jgi:hypothetical protein
MRGKVKKVCFLKLMDEELLMKHGSSSLTSLRGVGTLRTPSFTHAKATKVAYRVSMVAQRDKSSLTQAGVVSLIEGKDFSSPSTFNITIIN